eukprot:g15623.t1
MEHKLRTPLMVGAATGHISAVGAVLASIEDLFGDGDKKQMELLRKREMTRQMEITDVDDMTLLMHASCSGNAAMFNVVTQEIQRSQFRRVLTQQDANGMTFLHHAINSNSDQLYRRQLLARDSWGRSALEHALTSGRSQVFEVVYDAIREDIYDDELHGRDYGW